MGKRHGSPDSEDRHVGSLGNIESDGTCAKLHLEDHLVQVIGPYSIIGRSVVVYEHADDLGKVCALFNDDKQGSTEKSLVDGNVGRPIGAGIIGIASLD